MAPTGPGKRKRGDRSYSGDSLHDGQRPSPHRPGSLNLAQYNQQQNSNHVRDFSDSRGRGSRRSSRGGRGFYTHSTPLPTSEVIKDPRGPADVKPTETPITNGDRVATPMPPAAVAAPEPAPDPSLVEPKLFAFEYISNDTCETWEEGGRDKITNIAMRASKDSDDLKLAALLQELVESAIALRIPATQVGLFIKQLADSEKAMPGEPTLSQASFLDSISVSTEHESLPTKSISSLRDVIFSSGISADLLRQELDATLLEKLGLIRNTFARMGIRKQTNVLYRQANFNLMREESEGFAKLITELFTTTGNEPPSAEVVEETVEKVKAMIGAFDLDVGRSLDVVLDVFGAVLIKQFRFFVKFLRASPWWPRENKAGRDNTITGLPLWALPGNSGWYLTDHQNEEVATQTRSRDQKFWARARDIGLQAFYEVGRRHASEDEIKKATLQQSNSNSGDESMSSEWIKETRTHPPTGNRDAAQLLGFKLLFYSSSPARDEKDVLPDHLIYLSALLIKIGFISLKDLYPHIWRSDGEMEELKKQMTKEKADRERDCRPGAGSRNALLMAGALVDDMAPIPSRLRETGTRSGTPAKEAEPEKPAASSTNPTPEAADQKVHLLKSLLAIGALPEALFILGRFPWLLDLDPEIPEYIHRILHHSLSLIYDTILPLQGRESLQEQRPIADTDVPGRPKGYLRLTDAPIHKTLRWARLDRTDSPDGLDYRFYWDEWNDNVPICHTVDDFFILCETLVNLVGVKIGHDPTLLMKFARIGRHSLKQDDSEHNRTRWAALSKRLLLPALSFTKSNAGVVNEVFELINNLPLNTRYLMYLEWSAGRTSRLPEIKTAFDQAKAETKDVLKRISKTNVRPMARSLAKIAFANPHIVITTAMGQIEVYDGIAEVFVEGARYFTDLGYDILTWAMISSMARAGRSRTQESGLFTSKWLMALASFAGKIFKRYNMMKPGPVLKYVAEQLEHGNLTDLVMLEQIVLSMAGITTDTNYNDAQLQAMGGGELLQSQTILQLLDRRHESRVTAKRLIRSLRDSGLTGKLLLSMAQQRQACIYARDNDAAPLKLVGNIFDEIHRIMVQYLDLLRSNLAVEDFRAAVPDVVQLLFDYRISPEIAFQICRPLIRQHMLQVDKELAQRKREEAATPKDLVNGDEDITDQINVVSEEDGETLENDDTPDLRAGATPTPAEINGASLDVDQIERDAISAENEEVTSPEEWHPVLEDLMASICPHLPEEVVDIVGVGFYVTFWQLSLYDIAVPSKSYDDEISRQSAKVKAISADRSDMSKSGMAKKELQKQDINNLIERLLSENMEHIKAFKATNDKRLKKEKNQWFAGKGRIYEQLNTALMEHCFLPRMLCSPIDSYFCFKLVKFLHSSGTANFRTLGFYDLIFKQDRLTSLIFTCTSKEADNLGRFLNEVLRDLGRWHGEQTVYEREAFGSKRTLPGFAMKLNSDGKPLILLDFESFRRILYRWHQTVFSALNSCLVSSEYMHIRNAISVLRSISQHFPAINFHGTGLRKSIEALGDSDKEDLKLSSKAIMGALNRREKSWMMPQAFRKGQQKDENIDAPATSVTATTGKLNAEAHDFKPSENEDKPRKKKAGEDGEVQDTVMTDTVVAEPSQSIAAGKPEIESNTLQGREKFEAPNAAVSTPVPSALPANGSTSERVIDGANASEQPKYEPYASSENSRRHELPRRVEPVRSLRPSPSLPSRPEPNEHRNSRRGDHVPARPLFNYPDAGRHAPDGRLDDRHERLDDRTRDPIFDRTRPYPRGNERDDRMPSDRSIGTRGPEREHNTRYPLDRSSARPQTRDASAQNGPDAGRDRLRPLAEPRSDRDRLPEPRSQDRPGSSTSTGPPPTSSVTVNPERAALIIGDLDKRPDMSIRGQAQERVSRGSRPSSPKPSEDRRYPSRQDRTDEPRHFDRRMEPNHSAPRQNMDMASPTGPRSQRFERPGPSSNGYGGDIRHTQRPQVDMQHGRLEQEPTQIPHPSTQAHDRPSEPEVPSGPRGRASQSGTRGRGEVLQLQSNTQVPMASAERSIPTGPSIRSHIRTSSYHEQPPSVTASAPSTPADTTGVHPDRLKHIAPSPANELSRQPSTQAPTQPRPQPPLVQTSPPLGPRGGNAPANAPSGPSPTTRAPPSGPHLSNDISARGGRNNRHPLTAVNNTLQQAGQGTSIRGRGNIRQNSGPVTPHMGPTTPTMGSGQGPASAAQPDLFSGTQNGDGAPNGDMIHNAAPDDRGPPSRLPPPDRRTDLIDDDGRRSSRHSSRVRTPERDDRSRGDGRESHRSERDHIRDRRGDGDGPRDTSGRYGEPRRSGRIRDEENDQGRPPLARPSAHDDRRGYESGPRGDRERGGRHGDDGQLPPKRGREGDGPPYSGRGGMRSASENKRSRRGG